jgi:hypothetical protein
VNKCLTIIFILFAGNLSVYSQKSIDEWKAFIIDNEFQVIQQVKDLDSSMVNAFNRKYGLNLYTLKNPNDEYNYMGNEKGLIYAAEKDGCFVIYYLSVDISVSTEWLFIEKTPTDILYYRGTPPFEYRKQPYKQEFKYFKADMQKGEIDLSWFHKI